MANNNALTYAINSNYVSTGDITMKDLERTMRAFNCSQYVYNGSTGDIIWEPIKPETENKGVEEWVWVTGYKATNKDMKCRDYQYELGKQHDMPADATISMCHSGFHFCDKLNKTFNYYAVQDGNRYFEVKALVRRWKKDNYFTIEQSDDKMVAKSIILTRELSIDEIFNAIKDNSIKNWTTEQKELARQTNINNAKNTIKISNMVELGYSEAFATYVVNRSDYAYDFACTMANTPGVSMDVKILTICMRMFK